MANMSVKGSRFRDVDRESKILRDSVLMFDQNLDHFAVEMHQDMIKLKHNSQKIKVDVHPSGRGFPRTVTCDINNGFHDSYYWDSSKGSPFEEQMKKGCAYKGSHTFRYGKELPLFDGSSSTVDLFDWGDSIEEYFAEFNPPDALKCKIAASKLEGSAHSWWKEVQNNRVLRGKHFISSWDRMRKLLISKFEHTTCSIKCPAQPFSYQQSQKEPLHVKIKPISPKSGGIDLSDAVIKPNVHDNTKMILKEKFDPDCSNMIHSGINAKQEGDDCEGTNKVVVCSKEGIVCHESNDIQITEVAVSDNPFSTLDVKQESGTDMAGHTIDGIIMPAKCSIKLADCTEVVEGRYLNPRQSAPTCSAKFDFATDLECPDKGLCGSHNELGHKDSDIEESTLVEALMKGVKHDDPMPKERTHPMHMDQLVAMHTSTARDSYEGVDAKIKLSLTAVRTPILANKHDEKNELRSLGISGLMYEDKSMETSKKSAPITVGIMDGIYMILHDQVSHKHEEQHEDKWPKWVNRFGGGLSSFPDDHKNLTCLFNGMCIVSFDVDTKLVLFLFDPGGLLYLTRSTTLRLGNYTKTISLRLVPSLQRKCYWGFDILRTEATCSSIAFLCLCAFIWTYYFIDKAEWLGWGRTVEEKLILLMGHRLVATLTTLDIVMDTVGDNVQYNLTFWCHSISRESLTTGSQHEITWKLNITPLEILRVEAIEFEFMNDGFQAFNFDLGGNYILYKGRTHTTSQSGSRFVGSVKSATAKSWTGVRRSRAIVYTRSIEGIKSMIGSNGDHGLLIALNSRDAYSMTHRQQLRGAGKKLGGAHTYMSKCASDKKKDGNADSSFSLLNYQSHFVVVQPHYSKHHSAKWLICRVTGDSERGATRTVMLTAQELCKITGKEYNICNKLWSAHLEGGVYVIEGSNGADHMQDWSYKDKNSWDLKKETLNIDLGGGFSYNAHARLPCWSTSKTLRLFFKLVNGLDPPMTSYGYARGRAYYFGERWR